MQTCINVSSRLPRRAPQDSSTPQPWQMGPRGFRKGELVEILWTLHPCLQAFAMGFSVIFHSMPSSHFARAFLSSRSYSCHSARSRGSQHQARLLWVPVLSTWGCHMPCWKHSVPWSQCCKCEFVRSAESARTCLLSVVWGLLARTSRSGQTDPSSCCCPLLGLDFSGPVREKSGRSPGPHISFRKSMWLRATGRGSVKLFVRCCELGCFWQPC